MTEPHILKIGKSVSWFSFSAGTTVFFSLYSGFMTEFVVYSGLILCLFALLNTFVFLALMICGFIYQSKFIICLKSAAVLLINIPIVLLYGCLIDI